MIGKRLRQNKQRGSHKKLKEIEITAKRLGKLLSDDVFRFVTRLPAINDDGDLRPSLMLAVTGKFSKLLPISQGRCERSSGIDHPWNAFELLVGTQLAGTYERFSGNSVKLKRRVIEGYSQELEGKFLSFALQALESYKLTRAMESRIVREYRSCLHPRQKWQSSR